MVTYRDIQNVCERNLVTFFGIRFLASEYRTGHQHKGRIDTLGIDENNCPVIIEYTLDHKTNIINQGLFYLDWLMDHRADFAMLCMDVLGTKPDIDWQNPRLLCIAQNFHAYDKHAIAQINRNIELIRYRLFEDHNLLFELFDTSQEQTQSSRTTSVGKKPYRGIEDAIKGSSDKLLKLYQALEDYMYALGDDVIKKELKHYHAFSRIKNFVCVIIHRQKKEIKLSLRLDYGTLQNPPSHMRSLTSIGHLGTGDTEARIKTMEDLEAIKSFIEKAYHNS